MKATQILAEFLIIGILTIFSFISIFNVTLGPYINKIGVIHPVIQLLFLTSVAYAIGYFINVFSEIIFSYLHKQLEIRWLAKYANPSINMGNIRYELYASAPEQVIQRLDYHRSFLRLSRCIGLSSIIFIIFGLVGLKIYVIISALVMLVLSVFSYARRVRWYSKSSYLSWLSLKKLHSEKKRLISSQSNFTNSLSNVHSDKKILVFAGGTGFREINRALIKMTENVTRIVPIFDNGGSSKILREYFSIMSIGDIRNALITMASHEGEIRKVLKLFNWRLPIDDSTKSLKNELNSIIEGKHLLIRDVDPNLKCVISGYLRRFSDEISEEFDLKNGSIGNFILVGAYLSHNEDINSAIYVFRQLCGIKGNVLPVSLANNAHLGAEIRDNGSRKIFGQEMITNIDRSKFRNPIERVFLLENIKSNEEPMKALELDANPLVIDEIKNSDLIVYGPGSFFSSIFPHFFINGIADEISLKEGISKVFIANLTESNETYNQSIEELLAKLSEIIESKSIVKKSLNKYITHILINRNVGSNFVYGSNRKYLPFGNLESFKKFGITIIERDLEDPWRRGYHDPIIVSNILASLCCS